MISYSIINKSQLEGALRLDAEFYCGISLLGSNFYHGKDIVSLVQYGTSKELNDEGRGYPVLRLNEFEEWFAGQASKYCDKISDAMFESLKLKKGDVLICRTNGNPKLVGKAALVLEDKDTAFASYLFRIRTNNLKVNASTLVAFLNSKIGRAEIEKFLMPSIQSNFSPAQFRQIKVPIFPSEMQKEIETCLLNSYNLLRDSKSLYLQAEDLLLEELGLKDFQVEDDLSFVVNLSDIQSANRIDAEYFHPKFQKLVEQIEKHNAKLLGDLVSMKKGFEPGSEAYQEEGKLFIRVSSLSKFGIDDKDQKYLSEDLYKNLKKDFEPQVGEVLLTKDATPGVAYVVKEAIEGIISGGILRLKTKDKIDSEYLALCINSIIGRWQAERDAGGSVIAHWKPEQIKNILIPVLLKETQEKIAELVKKSHEARKKSKELLEEAKRKVETSIETQSRADD